MGNWITVTPLEISLGSKIEIKDGKACVIVEDNFCNTSACVLGHAALIPEFKKLGLGIKFYTHGQLSADSAVGGDVVLSAGGHRYFGVDAGKVFFGLTDGEAKALFHGNWSTPKEAAKVVEALVAGKIKEYNESFFRKEDMEHGYPVDDARHFVP